MKRMMYVMRSGVTALLFLVLCQTAVFAQEQQSSMDNSLSPKFGIKGGLNLSNMYVDDVGDENMKLGLNLGLFAKIPLAKGLSLQPELLYSSKGAKLTYDNFVLGEGEYRFNLNYVEVPVLAVINIAKNFNLQAGGYVGYLASANIKDLEDDGTIEDIADLEADDFKRFDYGLVGGLGVDVQNFTIGARYNYGLNEIGDSGIAGQLTNNAKNSVISVYIGIGF